MVKAEPEKKSDAVRRLVLEGELKQALKIAKDFRLGITKPQSRSMSLAYECMVHPDFYRAIGTDIDQAINDGVFVLKTLY